MVTLNNFVVQPSSWSHSNGIHTLLNQCEVQLNLADSRCAMMTFHYGFKCDGLSVPLAFRWFLPSWDYSNMRYNWAGAIHDALYGNKGFGIFSRSECDDIFRGALRESNISRIKASTADFAVGIAAKSHWGDDNLDSAILVNLEIV